MVMQIINQELFRILVLGVREKVKIEKEEFAKSQNIPDSKKFAENYINSKAGNEEIENISLSIVIKFPDSDTSNYFVELQEAIIALKNEHSNKLKDINDTFKEQSTIKFKIKDNILTSIITACLTTLFYLAIVGAYNILVPSQYKSVKQFNESIENAESQPKTIK